MECRITSLAGGPRCTGSNHAVEISLPFDFTGHDGRILVSADKLCLPSPASGQNIRSLPTVPSCDTFTLHEDKDYAYYHNARLRICRPTLIDEMRYFGD